jgi:large subunit ribosomal protein L4
MNQKERRLALATALNSAAADILVVDQLALEAPRTKDLVAALDRMGVDVSKDKTLLITADINPNVWMAGRNIERVFINTANAIRLFDVLNAKKIVMEQAALDWINTTYGSAKEEEGLPAAST